MDYEEMTQFFMAFFIVRKATKAQRSKAHDKRLTPPPTKVKQKAACAEAGS
tara:strand:- start:793 stop:945 length:153 start_codon:yes stop_codon:yes gene_type:complete